MIIARLYRILEDWFILIFIAGIILIIYAGPLGRETENLISIRTDNKLPQEMTFTPIYLEDANKNKIGWWQIKMIPRSIMVGDTALLEVSYKINPDIIPTTQPDSDSPREKYLRCQRLNRLARHWSATAIECGAQPENADINDSRNISDNESSHIDLLLIKIQHSDLPISPDEKIAELKASDIFMSREKSGNYIWRLNASADKVAPGRKHLILDLSAKPNSIVSNGVSLDGLPVEVNGTNVAVQFDVLTPGGFSRQAAVWYEVGYKTLGAIFSSAAFLMILKWFLYKKKAND